MCARNKFRVALMFGLFTAGLVFYRPTRGEEGAAEKNANENAPPAAKAEPRSLADYTKKGLEYLGSQQHDDGGWGQGGGWRTGGQNGQRREGDNVADPSDLGNTCIAALALIRSGSTPQSGPYANQLAKAAEYICAQVAKANVDGLYVTDVRDTQLQSKIGPYVDTFLAGLVLSELKGQMPNGESEQRLVAALDKTVKKIEANQKEDGTFEGNNGWASVLSQGICTKFLNRAAQQNVPIKEEVLKRDYQQSVAALDRKTSGKTASTRIGGIGRVPSTITARVEGGSDAGVDLYSIAGNAGRINFFYDANRPAEQSARAVLASREAGDDEKQQAKDKLAELKVVRGTQQAAVKNVVDRLEDDKFVAGFGNNGGEEFLSYMNISEMMYTQGGNEWDKWNKSISANLAQVQNGDGSWSGHHCITGRTFCTATALLTLMADRASSQLAAQIKNQDK